MNLLVGDYGQAKNVRPWHAHIGRLGGLDLFPVFDGGIRLDPLPAFCIARHLKVDSVVIRFSLLFPESGLDLLRAFSRK